MPNKNNVEMLEKVKKSIENSKGFFVVDYRGLTVKQAQDLRRTLRETNSEMKVYKNNIVRIALAEEGLPDIGESLVGTCAYVFFENDPVDAAKAIKKLEHEGSTLYMDYAVNFFTYIATNKRFMRKALDAGYVSASCKKQWILL